MKKRDILLDFTSLLDVTLILIFFFVIFSHMDNAQNTAKREEKEAELESQLNDAMERESQAADLMEQLEHELGIVQDADDRAKDNVEEILEFAKGTNLKFILEMNGDEWTLVAAGKNDMVSKISESDNIVRKLREVLVNADYDSEDTILCEFIYNGSQANTVSAYRKITKAIKELQKTYTYLYFSETDISVGEDY